MNHLGYFGTGGVLWNYANGLKKKKVMSLVVPPKVNPLVLKELNLNLQQISLENCLHKA